MRSAGEAVTVKAIVVRDATDHWPPCILVRFPYLGNEVWVREADLVPPPEPANAEPLGVPRTNGPDRYEATIITAAAAPTYHRPGMIYGNLQYEEDRSARGVFIAAVTVIAVIGAMIVTFGLGLR